MERQGTKPVISALLRPKPHSRVMLTISSKRRGLATVQKCSVTEPNPQFFLSLPLPSNSLLTNMETLVVTCGWKMSTAMNNGFSNLMAVMIWYKKWSKMSRLWLNRFHRTVNHSKYLDCNFLLVIKQSLFSFPQKCWSRTTCLLSTDWPTAQPTTHFYWMKRRVGSL